MMDNTATLMVLFSGYSVQASVLTVMAVCCVVFGLSAFILQFAAPHLGRREGRFGWVTITFTAMAAQLLFIGLLLIVRGISGSSWELHFNGNIRVDLWMSNFVLEPWAIMFFAQVLTLFACWLYWRELSNRKGIITWFMPVFRGLAILIACLIFTEPMLTLTHQDKTIARLLVFVDGSASMTATDERMNLSRKLRNAARMGWLEDSPFDDNVRHARLHLSKARNRIESLRNLTEEDWRKGAQDIRAILDTADGYMDEISANNLPTPTHDAFKAEIMSTIKRFDDTDSTSGQGQLVAMLPALERWTRELDQAMQKEDAKVAENLTDGQREVVQRHDKTPRWERLQESLLSGEESLFEKLTLDHKVDLLTLSSNSYKMIWHPSLVNDAGQVEMPTDLGLIGTVSNSLSTDLVTGVRSAVSSDSSLSATSVDGRITRKLFVVMATDGQHNTLTNPDPELLAQNFGNEKVQMHMIGLGTIHQPRDLAVVKVEGVPSKVQPEEKITGRVVFKDGMKPGEEFTITIKHEDKKLWSDTYNTDGSGSRETDTFEIDLKDIVEAKQQAQQADLRYSNLPLGFDVHITPLEGEVDADNNNATLRVNVITQKSRVLILDGRPRWEFRYLKNMFERDKRWEAHSLLPKYDINGRPQGFGVRGQRADQFPSSRERLFSYQLIIFGDIAPQYFSVDERKWLREFVQYNGGGIVFIDGHIDRLSSYSGDNEGLGPLFPVRWRGAQERRSMDAKYRPLTDDASVQMGSDTTQNATIWGDLQGPRRITLCEKLKGAETLVEVFETGMRMPMLVRWRYGAGKVLYMASDESWRWRLNVGDKFHEKFWKATAKATMEEPFAVMDQYVALDSGEPSYSIHERARIRVRLRDPDVMARLHKDNLKPAALLFRDGKQIARIPLDPDFNSSLFRGMTDPLDGGDYEVRVEVPGIDPNLIKVRTLFNVARQLTKEKAVLHCNKKLLQDMANASGGEYYAEEDMDLLLESLEEFSASRPRTEEYPIWQSYWTFLPIILLLTLEWVIRKRVGLL